MPEFTGGQSYSIAAKTMQAQADALLRSLGIWALKHKGRAVVWLNPSMQHVATLLQRSATLDWVTWQYDRRVLPPTDVRIVEEGA